MSTSNERIFVARKTVLIKMLLTGIKFASGNT